MKKVITKSDFSRSTERVEVVCIAEVLQSVVMQDASIVKEMGAAFEKIKISAKSFRNHNILRSTAWIYVIRSANVSRKYAPVWVLVNALWR